LSSRKFKGEEMVKGSQLVFYSTTGLTANIDFSLSKFQVINVRTVTIILDLLVLSSESYSSCVDAIVGTNSLERQSMVMSP